MEMRESPMVDWYEGRDVLVTGGTGFLGKMVVEKLLRSVPSIRSIFLLIRPAKGNSPDKRLELIRGSRVFDRVREAAPESLRKLRAVSGDLLEEGLGLAEAERAVLTETVSVVFHCAATVKFDEALRVSVAMNVVGTQRLVALCHQMPRLAALVHASTAYANCDRREILEAVYPPPIKPASLIDAFQWMSEEMIQSLTPKLVGARPNTYTFTKALAEFLLVEESGDLPTIIIRPSIIGAAWREPFPGWVDNLNGPTGLFIAVAKGLLQNMSGDVRARADIVPVDIVSNLLIVGAFHRATAKSRDIPVINCTSGNLNPLHWHRILASLEHYHRRPVEGIFRLPSWHFTTNRSLRNLAVVFNHFLPAYMVDAAYRLMGRQPKLVRLYRKLFKAVESLELFTSNDWDFQSKALPALWESLHPVDRETFDFDLRRLDWDEYLDTYHFGCKKFMLNQSAPDDLQRARTHYDRVALWSRLLKGVCLALLLRYAAKGSASLRRLFVFLLAALSSLYAAVTTPVQATLRTLLP